MCSLSHRRNMASFSCAVIEWVCIRLNSDQTCPFSYTENTVFRGPPRRVFGLFARSRIIPSHYSEPGKTAQVLEAVSLLTVLPRIDLHHNPAQPSRIKCRDQPNRFIQPFMKKIIPNEVLDVLKQSRCEGNRLHLPHQ